MIKPKVQTTIMTSTNSTNTTNAMNTNGNRITDSNSVTETMETMQNENKQFDSPKPTQRSLIPPDAPERANPIIQRQINPNVARRLFNNNNETD